jgi:hypothetical protein
MRWFKNLIFTILYPDFWNIRNVYSRAWDRELRLLMSRCRFKLHQDRYYCKLGNLRLYVGDYPRNALTFPGHDVRPSRLTTYQAFEKYIRDTRDERNGNEDRE